MNVDFSKLPAGGLLGDLRWSSDIDTMRDAGDLVPLSQGNGTLVGGDGNDTIHGGLGADTMDGGAGDDTYIVNSRGDLVIERANSGTDTVRASVSYTLTDHVENLVLTGSGHLNGTGNTLNNRLTGNAGNNILNGGRGADTLQGSAGNDTYIVDNMGDLVIERANGGTDTVRASVSYTLTDHVENLLLTGSDHINGTGNALNNRLTGNAGNNILNGGRGADTLQGGAGNDTYIVDNVGDLVIERANGGTDTVRASVSYTLTDHVENLVLTGSGHLNGTGNALNNRLTGNAGNNILRGGLGADTLEGGAGNDTLFGGDGNDTLKGQSGADRLMGAAGNDLLDGGSGDDTLDGGSGNDTLLGGDGNDSLIGGSGADRLSGNAGNDILNGGLGADTLNGGAGNDTLLGGADNDLLNGGSGADLLEGGAGHDKLLGGDGNDTLLGGAGNDRLVGGAGKDVLTGGLGADQFVFVNRLDSGTTAAGRDMITDFSRGQGDVIDLAAMDANLRLSGDQAFRFIGRDSFAGTAGELRYQHTDRATLIFADTDGDGRADFSIELLGRITLLEQDFLL